MSESDSNNRSLLEVAARVEAAMARYVSVRDISDNKKWEKKFKRENVRSSSRRNLYLIRLISISSPLEKDDPHVSLPYI